MTEKITLRGTAKAAVFSSYEGFIGASEFISRQLSKTCITNFSFFHEDVKLKDYTVLGTAVIEVTVDPPEVIVANEIAALREALRQERLRTENAQAALKSRISKLSALTMETP